MVMIDLGDVLTRWSGRSDTELRHLQTRLGGVLHTTLRRRAASGFTGVVFSDGACPGLGDAFTSWDGSSDYVRGCVTPISTSATADLTAHPTGHAAEADPGEGHAIEGDPGERGAEQIRAGVRWFLRANSLPGELFVGVAGALDPTTDNEVRITIADQARSSSSLVALPSATAGDMDDRLRALQHLAVIAALLSLARWLDADEAEHPAPTMHEPTMHEATMHEATMHDTARLPASTQPADTALLAEVERLITVNDAAWRTIRAVLPASSQLSVGESFTFGRLARLVSSCRGDEHMVNFLYGWYDKRFKGAMGVPDEQLTDAEIATPLTIELATLGLMANAPGRTNVALGTTGWANNTWLSDRDDGCRDFFSVAAVMRGEDDATMVSGETLRCSVTSTADQPMSHGRRQLTRELGVSAALLLLTRRMPAAADTPAQRSLEAALELHCAFEIAPTSNPLPSASPHWPSGSS